MIKSFSIRRYLIKYTLVWVLITTALSALWVYYDAQHEYGEVFDASLVQSANVLNTLLVHNASQSPFSAGQVQSLTALQSEDDEEGHKYETAVSFQLWSDDKQLLLRSESAPLEPLAPMQTGFNQTQIEDDNWRTYTLFSPSKRWWLILAEEDKLRGELTTYIILGHIWPLFLVLPLLVYVIRKLINRGFDPLRDVAQTLRQKSYQDLTPVNAHTSPDETKVLIESLNKLFNRLQASYARESRFSADAAHELRNPLAALMIHTENALEDTKFFSKASTESQAATIDAHNHQQLSDLQNLKKGIQRLSHSVKQLLSLSKAESRASAGHDELSSMSVLFEECIQQHQHLITTKKQSIMVKSHTEDLVFGSRTLLMMILNNGLSNAINYSPDNSKIRLSSHTVTHAASPESKVELEIRIDDSGPGLTEEEMIRVKDRFYRVTGSEVTGAGLGLSIVEVIVDNMDGEWWLERSDLGGLAVVIRLDAKQDQAGRAT